MSTIDVNLGNPVLALAGAAILTTYTTGSVFQAGAGGNIGLQLWATIVIDGASTINAVTFSLETSNDGTNFSQTLAIPHVGAGTQDVEPAFGALALGTTYYKRITVPPNFTGAAKYFRLKAKASAAGSGTDSISVTGTAW